MMHCMKMQNALFPKVFNLIGYNIKLAESFYE